MVIKPRADVGGGMGVHFVGTKDALSEAKRSIERAYGDPVIEEYIPGETDAMRTVNLLFDRDSRLAAYFTTRKIRQWPASGGISVLSVSTNEWDLVRMMLPLFRKWQWRGPVEVELKVDARDGVPKVIEINPRFWGYLDFPIRCGADFPSIACRLALGASAASFAFPRYREGVKYVNPLAYLKALRHDILNSGNAPRAVARGLADLKGEKVLNNIQLSDPLAVVGKLAAELRPTKAKSYWFVPEK
jgi:predicted ATP-grasp superfamily ATP-dependent carboligase